MDKARFDTLVIHGGALPSIQGSAQTPIFTSSVYELQEGGGYHDILYPRLNNTPNHRVLGARLALLEGGEMGFVTASGMAAIASTMFAHLAPGGHALVQETIYGGTHDLVRNELHAFGMSHTFFDSRRPETWAAALKPQTKMIYTEAISNPLLGIADHNAIVAFAKTHRLVSVVDTTFATPVNFRPLVLGYDLAVHSATKYLSGHSDLIAGAVIGSRKHVEPVLHQVNRTGATLSPLSCHLLERGLKTLSLRVARQNDTALRVATWLSSQPRFSKVFYPGLASHPDHARAKELFSGHGGVVAFEVKGGTSAAERMLSRVKLALYAPSLGGVETLVVRPAKSSHRGLPPEERARLGITDGLIRMSVGLEDPQDIIDDLDHAAQA